METPTFDQLPQMVGKLFDKLSKIESLLQEKEQVIQQTDELLSVTQTAELLNLSVTTIYGKVSRKEIPVNKQGKRLYFYRSQLSDWIKTGKKKMLFEIDKEAADHLSNISKK
jgi:excisionase family DNA binding protein